MATLEDLYHPPTSTISRHTDTYPFISPSKHTSSLKKKVVLVTGAGRGIGRATALAFAAAGAHVACLSRTQSDLSSLVHEIQQSGYPRALTIVADVVDASAPSRVVKEVEDVLGPIDILINNAGISRISDIEHEKDMAKAWDVIDVNMRGTLSFIHAVVPSMKRRRTGIIINVVSVLAATSLPYFSAYSAAKAGLVRATEIMDLEFCPSGIHTYAVAPGMVAATTLGQGALNEEAHDKGEGLKQFMKDFVPSMTDTVNLPADTFVALCVEGDAKYMSGRYVDATQDLGEVLAEARKGPEGKIEKEGLYKLKVDTL